LGWLRSNGLAFGHHMMVGPRLNSCSKIRIFCPTVISFPQTIQHPNQTVARLTAHGS
jgi:hypothetical protein